MLICFVSEEPLAGKGGVAEFNRELIRGLAETQVALHVIAPDETARVGVNFGIEQTTIPSLTPSLNKGGRIRISRIKTYVRTRRRIAGTFVKLRTVKNNLVVLYSPTSLMALVAARFRIPYALIVHGGDVFSGRHSAALRRIRNRLLEVLVSKSRVIFCNSEYTASQLRKYNNLQVPTVVTYCGVSPELIRAATKYRGADFQKRQYRLLALCRLTRIKACDVLLQAFALARGSEPRLSLTIAGDGDEREALTTLVDMLGISDVVTFVGYVEEQETKAQMYLAHHMLVLSGRKEDLSGREEAFGIVYAEAAALGRIAIGPRLGGVPEVIEDGKTGYLVKPEDPQALCQTILKAISIPQEKLNALEDYARVRARELFTYERVAKMIVGNISVRCTG